MRKLRTKNKPLIYAKMTSKNQVTIPKQVREILQVDSHDELEFELQDTGEVLVRKREDSDNFWNKVAELQEKYDVVEEKELYWGPDVGVEEFD